MRTQLTVIPLVRLSANPGTCVPYTGHYSLWIFHYLKMYSFFIVDNFSIVILLVFISIITTSATISMLNSLCNSLFIYFALLITSIDSAYFKRTLFVPMHSAYFALKIHLACGDFLALNPISIQFAIWPHHETAQVFSWLSAFHFPICKKHASFIELSQCHTIHKSGLQFRVHIIVCDPFALWYSLHVDPFIIYTQVCVVGFIHRAQFHSFAIFILFTTDWHFDLFCIQTLVCFL